MEDKTFLDEKGLAELGRVVKDNFLGIEKLKELNELKAFVDSWHNIEAKYVTLKELEDFKTQHPHGDYLASIDDPITLLISEANEEEKKQGMRFGTWNYVFRQPQNLLGGRADWIAPIDVPILLINIRHNSVVDLIDELGNRVKDTRLDSNKNCTKIQIIFDTTFGWLAWRWCEGNGHYNGGIWCSPTAQLAFRYVGLSERKIGEEIKKLQNEITQLKNTIEQMKKE
ncbi:hypothetical protein HKO22_02780 [Peptoniphilus sp. AGMB00490]|uniref:Uncharacterized protein n=1 Tax=Peptoniphilus faecalis TaxID=2731255 RepID=A0A848RA23_9FIRM|nr:hypothetical protein [Peptoniphilus faecalis]NMW84668.1 hypothetical protein [Peptoniphilus faecalis]